MRCFLVYTTSCTKCVLSLCWGRSFRSFVSASEDHLAWGSGRGFLLTQPSHRQALLSIAWPQVSITRADDAALPEALHAFGSSAHAQFMHGGFSLSLKLIRPAFGLSPHALLPVPHFLELCLPVCELLSALAGVQPHAACPCISIPTPSAPWPCGSHSAQRLAHRAGPSTP